MRFTDGECEDGDVLLNGRRLHFRRQGSGPPLILIHGLLGSLHNWRFNIAALAASATVYAIDLLNMGASDRVVDLDASLEATADRIVSFMDALGIPVADLAGHSHGGAVALALAARHPSRIGRLVLFAPANPFCDLGEQLIRFYSSRPGRIFARSIPLLPRWTKAVALGRMYGDPSRVAQDALDGYTAGLRKSGTIDHVLAIVRGWSADMARLRLALLALPAKPTLLIWGGADRAVSVASASQLQRLLPQASLVVLPGVGHIPFEEMPAACNEAVLSFLKTSSRATASSSTTAHSPSSRSANSSLLLTSSVA